MAHYNNGNGQAVCGSEERDFVSWKKDCGCYDCAKLKENLQKRIRKMRRIEADRIILQSLLADKNADISLEDREYIRERLREIKIERENLFPRSLNEAYFMGEMQEGEAEYVNSIN